MFSYQVYGHVLESSDVIPELYPISPAVPDLQIEFHASLCPVSIPGCALRLDSQYLLDCGEPLARLYESPTTYLLRYTNVADFVVSKSGRQIRVFHLEGACAAETRIFLLGGVLSFALELRRVRALHASAIATGSGAVAFLGGTGSGKTTLAAAFVKAGNPLLTDDVLALTLKDDWVWGYPGYPQVKMWPQEAMHFLRQYEHLDRVLPTLPKRRVPVGTDGFGTFCHEPQPLRCVYLPVRRDPGECNMGVSITPVSLADAVIELTRHSYVPRAVEAIGLQPQRLDFFIQMIQQVPIRRLNYPSGLELLSQVHESVLEDIEK